MIPILGRTEDPIIFERAGFVQYSMGLGLGFISSRVIGLIWINRDPTITPRFPGQKDFRKFMFSFFRASEEGLPKPIHE